MTRPALAALGTLEFTFIYNDFFIDNNLIAAGAILVALPTLIVFFALQKHFISGLTLGSTKG